MRPYKSINDLDRLIKNISYHFKFSKNKKETNKILSELNSIKNDLNMFLDEVFYADVFEVMLMELIITKIRLEAKLDENHIYDLKIMLSQIAQSIKEGKDLKATELISYLKSPYEKLMINDFEEKQDLNRIKKLIKRIPNDNYFLNLIYEFTQKTKNEICLTKS
jgi:hypothetical protein